METLTHSLPCLKGEWGSPAAAGHKAPPCDFLFTYIFGIYRVVSVCQDNGIRSKILQDFPILFILKF